MKENIETVRKGGHNIKLLCFKYMIEFVTSMKHIIYLPNHFEDRNGM